VPLVRPRASSPSPFRQFDHDALTALVGLLLPVTPAEWWCAAEELLYQHCTVHGMALGGYRGFTLADLDDMYWGDLPGQMLWWVDMLRKHRSSEKQLIERLSAA
jgi:hypothetical protein